MHFHVASSGFGQDTSNSHACQLQLDVATIGVSCYVRRDRWVEVDLLLAGSVTGRPGEAKKTPAWISTLAVATSLRGSKSLSVSTFLVIFPSPSVSLSVFPFRGMVPISHDGSTLFKASIIDVAQEASWILEVLSC